MYLKDGLITCNFPVYIINVKGLQQDDPAY